jgi:putative flippase GtrA
VKRFLQSQVSSFIATVCDWTVSFLLHYLIKLSEVVSSSIGTFAGGCVNFIINRQWVFKDRKGKVGREMILYFIVWLINFCIVQLIVYLFKHHTAVRFEYAKLIASLIAAIFNYLMQHTVVFAKKKEIFSNE